MRSINISKRKFDNLKNIELPSEVVSTEANFYKFTHLGKVKVFKNLHKTSGPVFANKLFTLEMLNEYREILPHNFVLPDSLIAVDKEIKGFDLPYVRGINLESLLASRTASNKLKIHFLKKIGDILNQLSHIRMNSELDSIFINDLHASNFIADIKNDELKVLDLDSCRICDSKPFPSRYLTPLSLLNHVHATNKYDIYRKELIGEDQKPILQVMTSDSYELYYCENTNYRNQLGFVNSNEESDLYCYVILFLNFLYGSNISLFSLEQFYDYLYYLERIGFDDELIQALIKIVTNAPNENIGPYLDTITDEQIARAHNKIYKIARNKI